MGTFSCLFANFIIFFIYFFWQLAFGILAFGFTCAKHTVATQRTYHRVVDLSCVSLAVTGRGGTWRRSEYYPRCRPAAAITCGARVARARRTRARLARRTRCHRAARLGGHRCFRGVGRITLQVKERNGTVGGVGFFFFFGSGSGWR